MKKFFKKNWKKILEAGVAGAVAGVVSAGGGSDSASTAGVVATAVWARLRETGAVPSERTEREEKK
jgi:hypothetical protein